MTSDIATLFAILIVAVLLFITEQLRFDAVLMLVLMALAATGPVMPCEALPRLGNQAVVTVWEVLIRSGRLVGADAATPVDNLA